MCVCVCVWQKVPIHVLFIFSMATMNSWSQTTQQTTDYNYTPYSQSTYYDSTSGQYYDPTTGQYYDYAAYYAQQQAASGTVTQSK